MNEQIINLDPDLLKITDKRIRKSLKDEEAIENLKVSMRDIGQATPIFIDPEMNVLDGELRLKIFKRLRKKYPKRDDLEKIKCVTIKPKHEIKVLKRDVEKGKPYYVDTAVDRLNNLGVDVSNHKQELIVGRAIREEKFDRQVILDYKNGNYDRSDMISLLNPKKPKTPKKKEEVEEFDASSWL